MKGHNHAALENVAPRTGARNPHLQGRGGRLYGMSAKGCGKLWQVASPGNNQALAISAFRGAGESF
jgi:hypothetical protein